MSEIRQTRMLEPPGFGSWGAGWRTLGDGLSRRLWSLQSEALCAEARRRTGFEDFGDPPIEPALSILLNSLELQADLHPLGRFLMRVHLLELLETRLRLVQTWSARSQALLGSPIQRPIFITGMPRGGSADSRRERIRFIRCVPGRHMNAWRSIVTPSCPESSSRFAICPLTRHFCTRRTLAPPTTGRNAFCNICSWALQLDDGF